MWHKAAPAGLAPNLSFILQLLLHLHTQKPLLTRSLALFDAKFGNTVAKLSLLPCTTLLLQHMVQQLLHIIR